MRRSAPPRASGPARNDRAKRRPIAEGLTHKLPGHGSSQLRQDMPLTGNWPTVTPRARHQPLSTVRLSEVLLLSGHHTGRSCSLSAGPSEGPRRAWGLSVRTPCTGFKAAPSGRSRRRLGTARPGSRSALARPASVARSAGAKAKAGPRTPGKSRNRGGFDTGTLAAAPSGSCGRPGKVARSRASVQPSPQCQIRHSAGAELTDSARRRRSKLPVATVKTLLTFG